MKGDGFSWKDERSKAKSKKETYETEIISEMNRPGKNERKKKRIRCSGKKKEEMATKNAKKNGENK